MKFSLLISIYAKEIPSNFDTCMQSIWDDQTVKPNEIVLVEDGKLTKDLYTCITKWKLKLNDTLKVVVLEENVGLGKALNIGLGKCQYDLVARMDTDDISCSRRLEKQLYIYLKIKILMYAVAG